MGRNHTHIWKPLLHEVAPGSLDAEADAVGYRAHAHYNGFSFKLGSVCGIDREKKIIRLAPLTDPDGDEILPQREESYGYLALAIGSVSCDFGIEGVTDHCIFLVSVAQAKSLQSCLVNQFIRLNRDLANSQTDRKLHVVIVGGGATSAELFKARQWFLTYGLRHVKAEHLEVALIEAGRRLLTALSERISFAVLLEFQNLGVSVNISTAVVSADKNGLSTKEGERFEANLIVWAAGVKAQDFLSDFGGLEINRVNQLLVDTILRVKGDCSVFALGDCAGFAVTCSNGEKTWVPPRAQSARQMASVLGKNIRHIVAPEPLETFQ
ncbi:MAG: NADH dehydrogenase [Oceanicoccus sp.]